MSRNNHVVSCLGLLTVGMLAIHIASIVVGAQHVHSADGECSGGGISFNLAGWLLYGGIIALVENLLVVAVCALYIAGIFGIVCCSELSTEIAVLGGGCIAGALCLLVILLLPMALFWIAWFITGIVLIATVPPTCQEQFVGVYVMAVIALVFQALALVQRCCITTQTTKQNAADAQSA